MPEKREIRGNKKNEKGDLQREKKNEFLGKKSRREGRGLLQRRGFQPSRTNISYRGGVINISELHYLLPHAESESHYSHRGLKVEKLTKLRSHLLDVCLLGDFSFSKQTSSLKIHCLTNAPL